VALDLGVIGLLVVAACVFVFGGFREFVGPVRISVRSADRLVVGAFLLTILRHFVQPKPSMLALLRDALSAARGSAAVVAAVPAFVATRAFVLLVGYLAVVTIGSVPGTERFRVTEDPLGNLLARWDTQWYLSIVTEGYKWNGNPQIEQNVVFFPAYPAAMRAVAPLFGDQHLVAGLVLALTAFLFALMYVYRLASALMSVERARQAVWLVAAYPFAVYYGAPYTESFYLLGAVGTFFHLHRAEYGRAAAWGFFLALCRPNGFFIGLPAAIIVLQRAWQEKRLRWDALAACAAPGLGVLAYCAYLQLHVGDGLAWMKGQAAWGRVYVGIGPGLYALFFDRFDAIAEQGLAGYIGSNPYDFLYSCCAIFMLASLWPSARRFGLAYPTFVAINILPPLLMGGMMSIGRMTSVLFPAFLWLAAALPERQLPAWVVAWSVMQGLIAVLFFTWRPVF
jgi:hypothetical protein